MDGRRTCLVVGVVVVGVVAGGTAASAVPGNGGGQSDQGNHFGQLKHGTTQTEPPPSPPLFFAPPATTPAVTETAASSTTPTATQAAAAMPAVVPGPVDKSLALPDLPKRGALPAVPPGSRDATSEMRITTAGGPRVLRLIVPDHPVTGEPVSFTIAAADQRPVTGVSFDFDEPAAKSGESACRTAAAAHQATFSVPFTFSGTGPHTVRFALTGGSCSTASHTTDAEVTIDVAKGGATLRAVTGPDLGVLDRTCPNADVLPTAANNAKVRAATLCLLNKIRKIAGLRKLRNRGSLRRIAGQHARDMVGRLFFDHTAPPTPASTFTMRLRRIRWKGEAGENLGFGTAYYATARAVAWAWMHSASHRANILTGSYRWVGIAIAIGSPKAPDPAAATYTTDFGGR